MTPITPTKSISEEEAMQEKCKGGISGELPKAIREDVMKIGDHQLRVYVLDGGRRVINQDDFHKFIGELGELSPEEIDEASRTLKNITPIDGD